MAASLATERIWLDKTRFNTAERQYHEYLNKESRISNSYGYDGVVTSCNDFDDTNAVKTQQRINDSKPTTTGKQMKKQKNKKNAHGGTEDSSTSEMAVVVAAPVTSTPVVSDKSNSKPSNLDIVGHKSITTNNKVKKKERKATASKKSGTTSSNQCILVSEIAKAREHIKNSLEKMDGIATLAASPGSTELLDRVATIEKENTDLKKLVESLRSLVLESQKRITALESQCGGAKTATAATTATTNKATAAAAADDDDDVDLFGSDSEEESAEAARIREERLAAYAAKKSKKPALIAKSSLVLDVKPWDDETDLKQMEGEIRKIVADGLLWGASKFVPVAFGIQKLSISCVVEDDKISIDWLTEEIEKLEDFVQSVDVAAFNKI